jgi:hypothetical protein
MPNAWPLLLLLLLLLLLETCRSFFRAGASESEDTASLDRFHGVL